MTQDPYYAQLRRLNRKVDVANMLSAAQLVQEQRIIAQNRQLLQLQEQQAAEERWFRFKIWLQSPAGVHYERWEAAAVQLAARIATFDQAWHQTWDEEVAATIPPEEREMVRRNRYLPRPTAVRAKDLLKPPSVIAATVIFALLIAFNLMSGSTGPTYWLALVALSVCTGALVWTRMYENPSFHEAESRMANDLYAKRVNHFGLDPLTNSAPSWSMNDEHTRIRAAIEETIRNAPSHLPDPKELPPLSIHGS